MCFFPGGFQSYLIPPSEKASKLADYLRIVIFMHFALAIAEFFGGRYISGVFDLLGALIGYLSIRHPTQFNLQQVLCYTIFMGLQCIWAIIEVIVYFSGVSTDEPSVEWQLYVYVGTVIAGPIIYFLGAFIGWHLYKDLKQSLQLAAEDAAYGGAWGGGQPQWGAQPQQQAGGWQAAPAAAPQSNYGGWSGASSGGGGGGAGAGGGRSSTSVSNNSGGFKPFTGEGHTLGGS
jgi:uncharacterized membrane protein YgcG